MKRASITKEQLVRLYVTEEGRTYPADGSELEQIDDELEEDVLLAFPSPRKYSVDLTITKITKRKLRLVGTEDTL